jgi:osmoprotectant transport system substrate-binding protein
MEQQNSLQRFVILGMTIAGLTIVVAQGKGPITIGSKIDTEGSLLCQMTKQALESKGYKVNDKCSTGTTQVVRKALLEGEIDLYPEYTGTGAYLFEKEKLETNNAKKLYQAVKALDLKVNKIVWLQPAPANNTWAIAIPKKLAQADQLKTMTDLAKYIKAGKSFKLAASQEFVDRADALKAFEKVYGFKVKPEQLVIVAGGNTTQTETAAAQGTSGVNAAMAYGTDGAISALGLVALTDTKGAVAVYQPVITVRKAVLDQNPNLAEIINPLFAKLDEKVLSGLNAKVAVGGISAAKVAANYLKSISSK